MKILDTKKAKERHEAEDEAEVDAERERREFEEWLNSASSTAPPNVDELKGLWDGFTVSPDALKKLTDSLHKQMGIDP